MANKPVSALVTEQGPPEADLIAQLGEIYETALAEDLGIAQKVVENGTS